MQKHNTRFNPTANGPLHIGHIYMALVNMTEAHKSGGKFILRIEDDQPEWNWRIPPVETRQIIHGFENDLRWMGIEPDEVKIQTAMHLDMKAYTGHLRDIAELRLVNRFMFDPQPELTYSDMTPYPYAPYLTAQRVIMDSMSNINLLIRGEDLLTEYTLYAFFCEYFGLPRPRMIYIPRLKTDIGGELLAEVSKTSGKNSIASYREAGINQIWIMDRLAKSCLVDPKGEWTLDNLQREPRWSVDF